MEERGYWKCLQERRQDRLGHRCCPRSRNKLPRLSKLLSLSNFPGFQNCSLNDGTIQASTTLSSSQTATTTFNIGAGKDKLSRFAIINSSFGGETVKCVEGFIMFLLFLFRYSAIPDFADCSEADRREAQDILDAVMSDSLLSNGEVVENSSSNNNEEEEDVTAVVERAIIDPSGSC